MLKMSDWQHVWFRDFIMSIFQQHLLRRFDDWVDGDRHAGMELQGSWLHIVGM